MGFDGRWWALMGVDGLWWVALFLVRETQQWGSSLRAGEFSWKFLLLICFLKRIFSIYFLFVFFVSRWIFPGIFSFYSWFTFFLSRQGGIRFNTVNMTPPILGIFSGTSLTSIIDWYSPKGVYRQIPSPGTVLVNIAPKAGWIENSHRGKLPHSKSVWHFSYNLCRKIIAIS